jgi:hypothetical protein
MPDELHQRRRADRFPPDPVAVSLVRGRGLAFIASLLAFQQAASSLWAKVAPLVADGLSVADAIAILNDAGPMLVASNDLWIMVATLIAAIATAVSKLRSWWRQRAARGP